MDRVTVRMLPGQRVEVAAAEGVRMIHRDAGGQRILGRLERP